MNRISEHCIYRAKIRGQHIINHVKGRAKLLHAFRFQRLPCYWLAEQMLLMDYWRRSAGESDEMARVAVEIERLTTRHNVHVQENMGQD